MASLQDLDHEFGGDLSVSQSGDLAVVGDLTRSQQRVLRRLMTNPGDYLWQPDYGGGLGKIVGTTKSPAEIVAIIRAQLRLEASVLQSPAPMVSVQILINGLAVTINYTEQDGSSQILSFSVSK